MCQETFSMETKTIKEPKLSIYGNHLKELLWLYNFWNLKKIKIIVDFGILKVYIVSGNENFWSIRFQKSHFYV